MDLLPYAIKSSQALVKNTLFSRTVCYKYGISYTILTNNVKQSINKIT